MIAVVTCGHRPDDERIYEREIKTLLKAGYKITYFTRWAGDNYLSEENLWHRNYSQKDISIRDYIQAILKDFQVLKPSVVHIHEFELLPLAKKAKRVYSSKIIYDVHDTLRAMWDTFSSKNRLFKNMVNKSLSAFEMYYLKYVDEIILANKIFDQNIYAGKELRTTVVENFPKLNNIAKKLKLSEPYIILYQGQVSEDRGILILVDAFIKTINEFSSVRLKILGPVRSKEFMEILQEKINKSNLSNEIELIGEIQHKEVWNYMEEAYIGVIPSLRTPRVMVDTPTKLFEYMATRCAVIATDVPPLSYFLKDAGELVQPGSIDELANGILKIIKNKKLFSRYTNEGIKLINEKYNWKNVEPTLLDIYRKVIS